MIFAKRCQNHHRGSIPSPATAVPSTSFQTCSCRLIDIDSKLYRAVALTCLSPLEASLVTHPCDIFMRKSYENREIRITSCPGLSQVFNLQQLHLILGYHFGCFCRSPLDLNSPNFICILDIIRFLWYYYIVTYSGGNNYECSGI